MINMIVLLNYNPKIYINFTPHCIDSCLKDALLQMSKWRDATPGLKFLDTLWKCTEEER